MSVLKLKWVWFSSIHWIQPCPKQLHSTSLIELHQQRWKKQSGARAEKEKVWEIYWLAAPGGEHPPHHTSWQHLPQGIHLNVIWQPSAISKLNLDIDLDTQFQGLTTLLRFQTQPDTDMFVLLRATPAEALHNVSWTPLLTLNAGSSKFLGEWIQLNCFFERYFLLYCQATTKSHK